MSKGTPSLGNHHPFWGRDEKIFLLEERHLT